LVTVSPALKKLDRFLEQVVAACASAEGPRSSASSTERAGAVDAAVEAAVEAACSTAEVALFDAMCDDLNTPRAGAALFGLLKAVDKPGDLPARAAARVAACLDAFNAALGIFYRLPDGYLAAAEADGDVSALVGPLQRDKHQRLFL
jgi:cysteinyl-tRNA synthetase